MNYRFSLIDYTFNSNGVTTVLSDEPIGWDSFEIRVKRDLKTHGITFEESVGSLGFHASGGGYNTLSTAYSSKGTESNTELLVEIACNDTYEEVYRGKLIYAKVKFFDEDDCYATLPIEQIGCVQTFANRIDQKVDLLSATTIDGTPLQTYQALPEEITLTSKPLIFISELANASTYNFSSGQQATAARYNLFASFDYELIKSDIENTNNASEELFGQIAVTLGPDYREASQGIINFQGTNIQCSGTAAINIRLKGTFEELSSESRIYEAYFTFEVQSIDGTLKSEVLLPITGSTIYFGGSFSQAVANTVPFDITYNPNVHLSAGDKIFVYITLEDYQFLTGSGGASNGFDVAITFEIGEFDIQFESQCESSEVNVFLVNEALSRTSEIISDGCLPVYSEYFGRIDSEPYSFSEDGCGAMEAITNGLLIRRAKRIDETDPKLFLSFKELYDGLNGIHCLGMGIEDAPGYAGGKVLRIERFDYFYQTQSLFTFADPIKIEVEIEPSRIFAQIFVGYNKWETDYYGGLDEIQSKREYKTDITSTDTKLDCTSNLIASSYAWELTRRVGTTTEDFKYDNNLFILCLDRYYLGYLPEYWYFYYTNILSVFYLINLRISPARNLLRWFKFISPTWNKEYATTVKQLIFSSGDGNYIAETEKTDDEDCLLETQPGSGTFGVPPLPDHLVENENIDKTRFKDAATYADPIWQPHIVYVDYPLSYSQFQTIRQSPYNQLTFTKRGVSYIGWILELKYKPVEGLGKFKLLLSWP